MAAAAVAATVVLHHQRSTEQQDRASHLRSLEHQALQRDYDKAPLLLISIDIQTALLKDCLASRALQIQLIAGGELKLQTKIAGGSSGRLASVYRSCKAMLRRTASEPSIAPTVEPGSTATWATPPITVGGMLHQGVRFDFRSAIQFVYEGQQEMFFDLVEKRSLRPNKVSARASLSLAAIKAALGTALTRNRNPMLHDLNLLSVKSQELLGQLQVVVRCQPTTVGEAGELGVLPERLSVMRANS